MCRKCTVADYMKLSPKVLAAIENNKEDLITIIEKIKFEAGEDLTGNQKSEETLDIEYHFGELVEDVEPDEDLNEDPEYSFLMTMLTAHYVVSFLTQQHPEADEFRDLMTTLAFEGENAGKAHHFVQSQRRH